MLLNNTAGVASVSLGTWGSLPGSDAPLTTATFENLQSTNTHILNTDSNFIQTLKIQMLESLNLNNLGITTPSVMINRTFALKFEESPLNQIIHLPWTNARVTGIFEDYHFSSFHNDIAPLVIFPMSLENK